MNSGLVFITSLSPQSVSVLLNTKILAVAFRKFVKSICVNPLIDKYVELLEVLISYRFVFSVVLLRIAQVQVRKY